MSKITPLDVVLGLSVAGVIGALRKEGDTVAMLAVVNAVAHHLSPEARDALYSQILEHSQAEGEA